MWVRAVWIEGDREEEGVVPDAWVKDGYIYWPPGVDASKAMETKAQPACSWRKFVLSKIKNKSGKYSVFVVEC